MDVTCDLKALNRFRLKNQAEIREALAKCHFNSVELNALVSIYVKLLTEREPSENEITGAQFRSILYQMFDMPNDNLIDRILIALDPSPTPVFSLSNFLKAMSLFLRGTFDERCSYCFTVYDIMGENNIKRDQLLFLLKRSVYKQEIEDAEEMVTDMSDELIKKLDVDLDGSISYDDFKTKVKEKPALMEVFGHCLPDREAVYAFLHTFTHVFRKF